MLAQPLGPNHEAADGQSGDGDGHGEGEKEGQPEIERPEQSLRAGAARRGRIPASK